MRDLEGLDPGSKLALFTKDDLVENETLTDNHIRDNVQRFKTHGKIPQSVYQAFNFKRPYFMSVFMPRLIKLSLESNDASSFLQAIKKSFKIP